MNMKNLCSKDKMFFTQSFLLLGPVYKSYISKPCLNSQTVV